MIKRIKFIRNFGIFRDFRWNSYLPEFAKLNLIYGWNYSGKTTLSRIFRSLENKTLDKEYSAAGFLLVAENDLQLSSENLSAGPAIRVFNRDYVEANFEAEYSAPSIFIVGEENIKLRTRLKQLNRRHERVSAIDKTLSDSLRGITDELEKLGTDKARVIRELLGDLKFQRPRLNQRIEEIRHDPTKYILADDDVSAHQLTLKSGDQLNSVAPVKYNLPDFVALARQVDEVLNQTASQRAIERLKQNRELESWIRHGLLLHKDTSTCEFCGATLPASRLEELRGHFSEEYENLVKLIEGKIEHIGAIPLNTAIPDYRDILPELRQGFSGIVNRFDDWIKWGTSIRDQFIEVLDKKKVEIEKQSNWQVDLGRAAEGQQLVKELNQLIDQHNETISSIEHAKAEAKTALERHYAARHFKENGIAQKEDIIRLINTRRDSTKRILERIESQIQEIEQRINESAVGVKNLNNLLRYLLPGNSIEVVSVGNDQFQFRRNGNNATHFSDGEKMAVTFAYFITSLEARGATIGDTIVFIDDPVSSLDSNHIYAVYALIIERLTNSQQLFVSTHNSELFNMLKSEWLTRGGGKNNADTRAYHVWRSVNPDGLPRAELLDLSPLLRRFKSEYEFIFSHLYEFANATEPSLHEAYTAPNLLRKFLEAYLGFRRPSESKWSNKLNLLFDSSERIREIAKFANDASHLQALDRVSRHPEFVTNAQRCVNMVLEALESRDNDHYESLCEVIRTGCG